MIRSKEKGRASLLRGSGHHQHQDQTRRRQSQSIRSLDYSRVHKHAGTPVHGWCKGEVPSRLAGWQVGWWTWVRAWAWE